MTTAVEEGTDESNNPEPTSVPTDSPNDSEDPAEPPTDSADETGDDSNDPNSSEDEQDTPEDQTFNEDNIEYKTSFLETATSTILALEVSTFEFTTASILGVYQTSDEFKTELFSNARPPVSTEELNSAPSTVEKVASVSSHTPSVSGPPFLISTGTSQSHSISVLPTSEIRYSSKETSKLSDSDLPFHETQPSTTLLSQTSTVMQGQSSATMIDERLPPSTVLIQTAQTAPTTTWTRSNTKENKSTSLSSTLVYLPSKTVSSIAITTSHSSTEDQFAVSAGTTMTTRLPHSTAPPTSRADKENPTSTPLIAAGTVGGLALIGAASVFYMRQRKTQKRKRQLNLETGESQRPFHNEDPPHRQTPIRMSFYSSQFNAVQPGRGEEDLQDIEGFRGVVANVQTALPRLMISDETTHDFNQRGNIDENQRQTNSLFIPKFSSVYESKRSSDQTAQHPCIQSQRSSDVSSMVIVLDNHDEE